MLQPANSEDTESGQYDLVIRATDAGEPPLFTDVQVTVKVGSISNQVMKIYTYSTYILEKLFENIFYSPRNLASLHHSMRLAFARILGLEWKSPRSRLRTLMDHKEESGKILNNFLYLF